MSNHKQYTTVILLSSTLFLWYVSSILNIPVLLALCAAYALVYVSETYNKGMGNKVVYSFLISIVLLLYMMRLDVYPSNISVIVAFLVPLLLALVSWKHFERKQITDKRNLALTLGAAIILAVGLILSAYTGLTWDEATEQKNFLKSLDAISDGLRGSVDYLEFNEFQDKYYGIGFYFPSYFFHKIFAYVLGDVFDLKPSGTALLLSRHLATFGIFYLSVFFFYKILELLTGDRLFSLAAAIAYLMYPLILGHSFMNVKDTPFASVWLVCIYYLLKILQRGHANSEIRKADIVIFSLFLGWLISIRISGILFIFPIFYSILYLVATPFLREKSKAQNLSSSFVTTKHIFAAFLYSAAIVIFMVSIAYPVFWQGPGEFLNAIRYMSQHIWNGYTLTGGRYIHGQSPSNTYILWWLLVQTPIVVIVGGGSLFFFALSRKLKLDFQTLSILLLILSSVSIVAFLIAREVVLYDATRQILFIPSMLLLIGLSSLFICYRKKAYYFLLPTVALFVADNIKLYPYNYVWFNEPARFFNLNEYFETDYWGSSGRATATWINRNIGAKEPVECIYAYPGHLFFPFRDKAKFNCVLSAEKVEADSQRPFLIARVARTHNKIYRYPQNCEEIHVESRTLSFSPYPLKMSSVHRCE